MERVKSKYSDWTRGQEEALLNIIGEENAKELLAGNISVEFKEVVKKLFDKNGRRIPEGLSAKVCDADGNFRLDQPNLKNEHHYVDHFKHHYVDPITRLHECLNVDTGITAEGLKAETERLLALIQDNSQIANIARGVCLPVVLPQLTTSSDVGTILEQYLEGVSKSYEKTFSYRRSSINYKGRLAGEIDIVDGSRYDQLIERMKQGAIIGIHFPNPLQGFSVKASRQQMSTLPGGFVLSGMDSLIAMVIYPEVLSRDQNTPGLDLAAFSWQSARRSLRFWALNDRLDFQGTADLDCAFGAYSGGLFFCG